MLGNFSHFYSNQFWGQLKDNCLNTCIDVDGLGTKNLLQTEKVCARNCMVHAFALRRNVDIFAEKQKSSTFLEYDRTFINKI